MSLINENLVLIEKILQVSKDAGESILDIYNNADPKIELKEDKSPLTAADISSHTIIVNRLRNITPKIPIISEEDCNIPLAVRSNWKEYWLIDPLDGTKEFINRIGEFTVIIALVRDNKPILGIIHVPVKNETYRGSKEFGSFHIKANQEKESISVANKNNNTIRIAASRSHPSKRLNLLLKELNNYEILNIGSSLKFCLVASGAADIYPRFGRTSEWDTAAGEAIVESAGGYVCALKGELMTYNTKHNFLNPDFLVSSSKNLILELQKILKKIPSNEK